MRPPFYISVADLLAILLVFAEYEMLRLRAVYLSGVTGDKTM
jgi:hypothetical protein